MSDTILTGEVRQHRQTRQQLLYVQERVYERRWEHEQAKSTALINAHAALRLRGVGEIKPKDAKKVLDKQILVF